MYISIFIGLALYILRDNYPNFFIYSWVFEIMMLFVDFEGLIKLIANRTYDLITGGPYSGQTGSYGQ